MYGHIVSRAVAASEMFSQPDDAKHISPVAALIFLLTCLIFFGLIIATAYTYFQLIPTLCMIESPESQAYVPVNALSDEPPSYDDDDDDSAPKATDPELLILQNKPITSSFRKTLLHLRARAGRWSRFRGFGMALVLDIATGILISNFGGALIHNFIYIAFVTILATTLTSGLQMTWIHIVISEPSPKRWYQRIPPLKYHLRVAPAVALSALAIQITHILPTLVVSGFGPMRHMQRHEYNPTQRDLYAVVGQGILAISISLLCFVGLQVPAAVTMVRVAASMLPEADETIVPFDRTFGGQTTPEIIGGQGKIGLVEAWRSFPRSSRMRLLRAIAKAVAIFMAICIAFSIVVVVESHLLFGENIGEVMKTIHRVAGPRQTV